MEVSALSFCANGLLTTVEAAEIVLFVSLLPEESCGFPGDIVGGGATGSAFAPGATHIRTEHTRDNNWVN